jgi:hypothetical protein
MNSHIARVIVPALGLLLLPLHAAARQDVGRWRIESGVWGPWVESPRQTLNNPALRGRELEFQVGRVMGSDPLRCAKAEYEFVRTVLEGLFQGSLSRPYGAEARSAGIPRLPLMTLSVRCDSGVFDYHFVARDKLLVALDDVVWTLTRLRAPEGPDAVVLAMLFVHMTGDMAFTPQTVALKRNFLTADLANLIAAYFKQPRPADEVPPINGDPFTNSQEYPDRFTIGRVEAGGSTATVPVVFRDVTPRERPVKVMMREIGGRWLIDDLRYEDGKTLRELLQSASD